MKCSVKQLLAGAASTGTAVANYMSLPPGSVWDRCDALKRNPEWMEEQRSDSRAVAVQVRRGVFVADSVEQLWAPIQRSDAAMDLLFLGRDEVQRPYFAQLLKGESATVVQSGSSNSNRPREGILDPRRTLLALDPVAATRATHAYCLATWHESAQFCGFCGGKTRAVGGGSSRKCTVEACGKETYPRTNPVAIMAVVHPDGDKLLLGQTKVRHRASMYSVLAGFVDQAESLEDAVRREAFEESGVKVGAVRYHSSQPWPFPGNLMLGCFAEAESTEIVADPHEMANVRWFSVTEIRDMVAAAKSHPTGDPSAALTVPPPTTVAHQLMQAWLDAIDAAASPEVGVASPAHL